LDWSVYYGRDQTDRPYTASYFWQGCHFDVSETTEPLSSAASAVLAGLMPLSGAEWTSATVLQFADTPTLDADAVELGPATGDSVLDAFTGDLDTDDLQQPHSTMIGHQNWRTLLATNNEKQSCNIYKICDAITLLFTGQNLPVTKLHK